MTVFKSAVVNQATFTFFNNKNETANIVLRMYPKRAIQEWTLELGPIPNSTVQHG